jgi:galactokinase
LARPLIPALRARFRGLFKAPPARVAFAPGRVNLIGDHTDYNDGFVLPMAIERGVAVAFRARSDRLLRAHSVAFAETRELKLDKIERKAKPDWLAYLAGVAWSLEQAGHRLTGLDLMVEADLPIGAGLSSSAAFEVAAARAFCDAAGIAWDPVAMAKLCRAAENDFVGVSCGLMDQYAAAASVEGCALLLDCRSVEAVPVPIPGDTIFVVMDTGARRTLVSSAYNDRLRECAAALEQLRGLDPGLRSLRDVTPEKLEAARERLDPVLFRRASHVVAEIQRPAAMAQALARGDLEAAGRLMDESHASLRDLYEVSSPELDLVCRLARGHRGCYGTRMTGAGFGGCAVALLSHAGADEFTREVMAAYRKESRLPGGFLVSRPGAGARLVD